MAGATGKFQLTVADEDNFDKIMAAIGLTEAQREIGRKSRPIMEFVRDGDVYKCIASNPGTPDRVQVFHLDQEQDEVAVGGRKVKSTYKRNGNVLIQHEKQEDGQVIIYERELKGDEMHVKVSLGNLVANRVYKKI